MFSLPSRKQQRCLTYDPGCIEEIILKLADTCKIQVVWDHDSVTMTGFLAFAGGLVGALLGGRSGAAIGAGLGGVVGIEMSKVKPLREIWVEVKDKLIELLHIVYDYLRKLDAENYLNAFTILMASTEKCEELVKIISKFISQKLGREVINKLTVAFA